MRWRVLAEGDSLILVDIEDVEELLDVFLLGDYDLSS